MKAARVVPLLLAFSAAPALAQDAREAPALDVVFHADLDGRLATLACTHPPDQTPPADYAALLGRLAAARATASQEGRPAPVALLGGNLATPDLYGTSLVERGQAGIAALANLLADAHYDAITLGHHDLSMSESQLDQLVTELQRKGMPVVATNLRCDGRIRKACPRVQADALIARGDLSVGVIATIAPSVVAGIPPALFAGLALDDPAKTARAATRQLRQRGASVVVLMAQGPRNATALDQADALARALAGAPAE